MRSSSGSSIPLFRLKQADHGRIKDIRESIVRVDGLPHCINGQLVDLGNGLRGMIMGYTAADVLVLVMGDAAHLRQGGVVTAIGEPFTIPVGSGCMGRILTALGEPCDNQGALLAEAHLPVMQDCLPIPARALVDAFLATGIKAVDLAVPLAKGQRQLILGDRMTGKTSLCLDAIANQKGRHCLCIYCAIGKAGSAMQKVVDTLRRAGALDHTAILLAGDSAPAVEQFLVPFAAATLGQFFTRQGRDVLVVFDDLTKHAWAYRQLALLMDRAPGREAYPGDIFYVQAQLIERAGRFAASEGGGSMTFLAIAETQQGDLTGLIPSNLAAMCDGQILLSTTRFAEGARPALDLPLCVSIVGRRAQPPVLRELSAMLRTNLAEYHALSRLSALQSGLAKASDRALRQGVAIETILRQGEGQPVDVAENILLLYGLKSKAFSERAIEQIVAFRDGIRAFAAREDADLLAALEHAPAFGTDLQGRLERVIDAYFVRAA